MTPHAPAERASALVVAAVALAQVALGIATLLHQVPIGLALVHQGGALVLLTAALWHLHRLMLTSPSPDRGRR
jgi:cytochrome c oxidase assembly protein subunit 15